MSSIDDIESKEKEALLGSAPEKKTWPWDNTISKIKSLGTKDFWKQQMKKTSPRVVIYFLLLVAFGVANSVSGRFNQVKFGENYAWFNNQFSTLMYCVLAQIITSWKYFFTKDITPEMKAYPLWKFALWIF